MSEQTDTARTSSGGSTPRDPSPAPATPPVARPASSRPSVTVKPLDGQLSVDDKTTLEINALTYRALARVAETIARQVCEALEARTAVSPPTAWICAIEDLKLLPLAAFMSAQITELLEAYREVEDDRSVGAKEPSSVPSSLVAPKRALALATGVFDTALQLGMLFRVDTQVRGHNVVVYPEAVVAALAARLRAHNVTAVAAQTVILQTDGGSAMAELNALADHRRSAERRLSALRLQPVPQVELITALANLNTAESSLRTVLDAAGSPEGRAALLRLVAIYRALSASSASLLPVSIVAAGGSNITRRTFWSARLDHTGGCVAAWLLIDGSGVIRASGVDDAIERGRSAKSATDLI